MSVSPFKSAIEIEADKDFETYISTAKALASSASLDLNWDSNRWVFPSTTIRFLKLEHTSLSKSKNPSPDQILASSFLDFSKAYVVHNCFERAAGFIPRSSFTATQLVEAAMRDLDDEADIRKLSKRHLDRACELIDSRADSTKINNGSHLQSLARHVSAKNLTTNSLASWKHNFKSKSTPDPSKLPNDKALLCLAEIFSNGHSGDIDEESIYITGITAILLSAPMRISEQAWLPYNALDSDQDSTGKTRKFLKYYSSKFDKFVQKPVIPIMSDHVETAISRLRDITSEGRNLARHYETSPNEFYRHTGCPDVDSDQVLSPDQIAQALGTSIKQSRVFVYDNSGSYSLSNLTLNKLWKLALIAHKKRNPYFPYQINPKKFKQKPLKMSESLICFRSNELASHTTSPILLAPTNLDHFNKRLRSSTTNSRGVHIPNFFERHGHMDIAMTSHQLRHFNNTAAQEAGLGIEAITEWSSRAKVQGSRTYMHRDEKQFAKSIGDNRLPALDITPNNPITEPEYALLDKGPIITTRYGICMHHWTISPCEKSGDCLNCSDLLHCKGHKNSLEAVRVERGQVAENLKAAEDAITAGTRAATRWVTQHRLYLQRLDAILEMHQDSSIPDGSPVRMQGKDFTNAKRILSVIHQDFTALPPQALVDDSLYSDDLLSCMKIFSGKSDDA
ncbi:hypothetical protein LU646_11215 [Pseudomonas alloputida]|uniref:hypothetical protein n=1 Tax=Pseudomonas alloputida TaxID=1940621 RepID=UPI001E608985|nr:hypothetical protein [Pseudomonas alloputida]MCE1058447.1 hypothetical protein [Pseudomonas alloputida]